MAITGRRQATWNFIDTLNKDQLQRLRDVLALNKTSRRYLDGMLAERLRSVYHVDPDTGEDLLVQ